MVVCWVGGAGLGRMWALWARSHVGGGLGGCWGRTEVTSPDGWGLVVVCWVGGAGLGRTWAELWEGVGRGGGLVVVCARKIAL